MRNYSPLFLGLATLSSALLVGCGGGGSSSGSVSRDVTDVRGGATLASHPVATTIASNPTPTSYTFGTTTAMIPAGHEIPSGSVAIVTTTTPILSVQGTGPFTVNGSDAGANLTNGSLSANVALPPTTTTPHTVVATAPVGGFIVPQTRSNRRDLVSGLTINGSITLGVPVLSNGTAGIPTNITGTIPVNGSNAANLTMNVYYPAAFSGYRAKLTVSWVSNGTPVNIAQTKILSSAGIANFSVRNGLNIPANGVDTVSIVLTPAP